MAEVKWIKVTTDIFDNSKIKQIRKMPDGDSIVVVWLQILCLAGRVNSNGYIFLTEDIPYTDEMLAVEFDQSLQIIKMALSLFKKLGMIDVTDNLYHVSAWEKYQNVDGLDRIREQNRLRAKRFRDKAKQELLEDKSNVTDNVTHNVTITQSNAIDIDKEEDKDKEKRKKKNSIESVVSDSDLTHEVKYTIFDFIEMRKLIKAPMTDRAIILLINKLKDMASDPATQIAILNQSIENSWKGIFPLRDSRTKPGNNLKSNWNINRDSTQQYQAKPETDQGEDFYQYITRKSMEGVN